MVNFWSCSLWSLKTVDNLKTSATKSVFWKRFICFTKICSRRSHNIKCIYSLFRNNRHNSYLEVVSSFHTVAGGEHDILMIDIFCYPTLRCKYRILCFKKTEANTQMLPPTYTPTVKKLPVPPVWTGKHVYSVITCMHAPLPSSDLTSYSRKRIWPIVAQVPQSSSFSADLNKKNEIHGDKTKSEPLSIFLK